MIGIWIGLPLGVLAALWCGSFVDGYIHAKITAYIFGAVFGMCIWRAITGFDILYDRSLQNPKPINTELDLPEAYGRILEWFKIMPVGPYFWSVKESDTENTRIIAMLKFTETMVGFANNPLQIERVILANVQLSALPPEEQKPIYPGSDKIWTTQVHVVWSVNSHFARSECNRVIGQTMHEIHKLLGRALPENESLKPLHPCVPPAWMLCLLVLTAFLAVVQYKETKQEQASTPLPQSLLPSGIGRLQTSPPASTSFGTTYDPSRAAAMEEAARQAAAQEHQRQLDLDLQQEHQQDLKNMYQQNPQSLPNLNQSGTENRPSPFGQSN